MSQARRAVEAVVSDTPQAAALGADLVELSRRAVETALAEEAARLEEVAPGQRQVEVSLTLTGDDEIRGLNRRYLGRDRATDVLSFPMFEGDENGPGADAAPGPGPGPRTGPGRAPDEPVLLGDVVVSVETARRQAAEYGRPFPEELSRLVVHGTLHLLGYEDASRRGAAVMRGKEDAVLVRLGFDPREPGAAGR
jgi:probable rRNA maturation factor